MILFVVCLGLWLLLSGHFDPLTLGLGVLSAALVAVANRHEERLSALGRAAPRLVPYAGWLLAQIWWANLQVVRLVLHPRLPIDPVVIRIRPALTGDLPLTTLANSITLTPGTVTLDVDGGELVVHALTAEAGREVEAGAMAGRVRAVFERPA